MFKTILKKRWLSISLGSLVLLAVFACALFISFTAGYAIGNYKFQELASLEVSHIYNTKPPQDIVSEEIDFTPFWNAWKLLNDRFVHSTATTTVQATDEEKLWGAIQGLASSYDDPYTVFFPPIDNKLFEEEIEGEFSGVGIEIGIRDNLLTVISPLVGTPAYNAGILPKDKIIEIDGKDATSIGTQAAVQLIRGQKGTPVVLSIAREGEVEILEITIIRDTIVVPITETEIIDDVFVIRLFSFTANSSDLFRESLQDFVDSDADKLIIDLRGNPGGYLQAAVSMASWFLSEDKVIVTESFEGKRENKEHYSRGYDAFNDNLRVVILTDAGSASASEILAGSLRDYNKALLVGQNTFGKGSVQELVPVTPDTSLKVTIAKWLLPSGDHIDEEGITPDVLVETPETIDPDSDYILEAGIETIRRDDFRSLFDTIN